MPPTPLEGNFWNSPAALMDIHVNLHLRQPYGKEGKEKWRDAKVTTSGHAHYKRTFRPTSAHRDFFDYCAL